MDLAQLLTPRVRAAFAQFDTDGDGALAAREVRFALRTLGLADATAPALARARARARALALALTLTPTLTLTRHAAFLTARGINHGINLRRSPSLQYLYYLAQARLATEPPAYA